MPLNYISLAKAVYYGVRIGTSTLSEFNKSSRVPITRKNVLTCRCSGDHCWNFGFLEMRIAHEFGSIKLKLVPTVCPPQQLVHRVSRMSLGALS